MGGQCPDRRVSCSRFPRDVLNESVLTTGGGPRPDAGEETATMFRTVIGVGAAVLVLLGGTAAGQPPAYFDQIGYTDLRNRLGAATPTGAGLLVTPVEAE